MNKLHVDDCVPAAHPTRMLHRERILSELHVGLWCQGAIRGADCVQPVGTCGPGYISSFPSSCTNRLIESSLGSVATKLNFFIHNLAQMKFTGSDDRLTLSFAPRTHTLKSSGRISDVFLCRHEKIFHPNKGYVSVFSSTILPCPHGPQHIGIVSLHIRMWALES